MKIYNSNPAYGDEGRWDLVAIDGSPMTFGAVRAQIVTAMTQTFREWAIDKLDAARDRGEGIVDTQSYLRDAITTMRDELYSALHLYQDDEWRHAHECPECGTLAPKIYDDEEHPSWDCAVCLAAENEED